MIPQLRPAAWSHWLNSPDGHSALILDVREPWEVDIASVKPLANTPAFAVLHMPMQSVPQRLNELPSDKPIAVLCHHGARSQQVASFLIQQGYEQVVNIAGGIAAWSQELDSSIAHY